MQVRPTTMSKDTCLIDPLGGSSKVLVVDDEPDIVEAVVELLQDEGFSCRFALNAQSALEVLQADCEIGIVVTDIRMPGMDGLEMARRMKSAVGATRDLFVILVTGHAGMQEAISALQLGAEDFLTKPISPDHLLHSVHRAEEMVRLRQHERNFQQQMKIEVLEKTAELKEANRKLSIASQIKDQFLSVMGHELRTPLNAINGFAELLKEKLQNADAPVCEYLENIVLSGNRLTETIENILEFSTAISGSRVARVELQNVEDLFCNVIEHLKKKALKRGIALQLAPLPASRQDQLVEVDGAMVTKALICLSENAIKFSASGTTVNLGMERHADALSLYVEDQGCGMTEDQIYKARQPLNQIDGTLTRPVEGIGLGLSLAATLSELQGGSLGIDSTPGLGTTVRLTFPQRRLVGH